MRRFYVVYSNDQIGETLFPQFSNLPVASTGRKIYFKGHVVETPGDVVKDPYVLEFMGLQELPEYSLTLFNECVILTP